MIDTAAPDSPAAQPLASRLLWLALPVLAEQVLGMLVGFVDTWLAGRFLAGESHLAAIGLMAYVMWLLPSLFAAVAIGATALVARLIGAGQRDEARAITNQAMFLAVLFAVVVTGGMAVGGPRLIALMQLRGDAYDHALLYLAILIPVIPAIGIEQVGFACLRGAGDTVSSLLTMTIVNVINVVVSFVLVVGLGPAPCWGWQGLAVGTAVGHGVGALLVLGLLLRGRMGLRLQRRQLIPSRARIRRLLQVGWPGGVDVLIVLLCNFWFVGVVNALGTSAAAAHSLGIRIESLAYLPGAAFQVAAATLAGQYLGARDPRRATHSVLLACLLGGGLMTSAGAFFFLAAEPLTAFFLSDTSTDTAALTPQLLRVVSLSMPFLALAMILAGALRGAGDTRWPLLVTVIGFLGVRIPLSYLLAWETLPPPLAGWGLTAGFGWGVVGAWYAMVTDIVVRSALVAARFWQGGWQRVKV